jgi:hypothetical protein
VLLQAYGHISVLSGGVVSAVGGRGGSQFDFVSKPGGDGGEGRIRFEDSDGVLEKEGTVLPTSQEANVDVLTPRATPQDAI